MRKKFKIFYPSLGGKEYKPPKGCMVVMNTKGLFFLVDFREDYTYCGPLHKHVPNYDVLWEN